MNYDEAKKIRDELSDAVDVKGAEVRLFPRNEIGLAERTEPYIKAKRNYDVAFKKLQTFNSWFVKTFKSEIRAERVNR